MAPSHNLGVGETSNFAFVLLFEGMELLGSMNVWESASGRMKAHLIVGRIGRSRELPDGGDKLLDRRVVAADLAFVLLELASQVLVSQHQLPQFHERAHDKHVDLHRAAS